MPEDKKRTRNYDKSPEGQAYRNQYRKEHYANANVLMPPELRDRIDTHAKAEGLSRTQYILRAVTEYMDKYETGTE